MNITKEMKASQISLFYLKAILGLNSVAWRERDGMPCLSVSFNTEQEFDAWIIDIWEGYEVIKVGFGKIISY